MNDFSSRHLSERGSAILMLFVAIALFAALAFAFMQGSRNSTSMMSDEQAKSYAQQIIAYGNDVKMAVKRLAVRGYDETQMDFRNSVFQFDDNSPLNASIAACADARCQVFNVAGGAIAPKETPAAATLALAGVAKAGHWEAEQYVFSGAGTAEPDLLITVHELSKEVCVKINELIGVPNTAGNPPAYAVSGASWTGSYVTPATVIVGNTATDLQKGQQGMCYRNADTNEYQYSTVLIAR